MHLWKCCSNLSNIYWGNNYSGGATANLNCMGWEDYHVAA